jgi:hypothetical protein
MAQEIHVHAEIPMDQLIARIVSNPAAMKKLIEAVRTALLQQARNSGDALGGYAGTKGRDLQTSPVFQGHWDEFGVWVKG